MDVRKKTFFVLIMFSTTNVLNMTQQTVKKSPGVPFIFLGSLFWLRCDLSVTLFLHRLRFISQPAFCLHRPLSYLQS